MYDEGMTISEVLADTLAAKKLTQTAAAEELGVKQSVVSRWVDGSNTPGDDKVATLAKFTGLTQPQILQALHLQRVFRTGMAARVRALEAGMAELKEQYALVVQLLEQLAPPAP